MKRGFGGLNTGGQKDPRPEELVEVVKPGKDFIALRLVGDIASYAQRWISIETKKGVIQIPKVALNYDPSTDSFDDTIEDPYQDIPNEQRVAKRYFINAIVRDLQDDEPRKKAKPERSERRSGFKDRKSKTWTPVRVLAIPPSVAKLLQSLITMNKHRIKGKTEEAELADPKYGCDIFISYDENAQGPNKYSVQKGEHSPLTDEELAYLKWNLEGLMKPESLEQAKKEASNIASKNPGDEDTEADEDEDDALDRKRSRKSKDAGKSRDRDRSSGRDRGERSSRREKTSSKSKSSGREKRRRRGL